MRFLITFLLLSIFFSCRNKNENVYDENDYILVKKDSNNGIVFARHYEYKFDPSRKLKIDYWDNGKVMAKGFLHNGHLDGEVIMYDISGKLMAIDSFHNGIKFYEKNYLAADTSVKLFKDGKLMPIKSIDELQ